MKKITSTTFFLLFAFFIQSCEKEITIQTKNIGEKVVSLILLGVEPTSDGVVFLKFDEYFDNSRSRPPNASFSAFARDKQATDFFESVTVANSTKIDKTSDNRFLSYPKLENNALFGKETTVEMQFKEMCDLSAQVLIPKRLNVISSIQNDDLFYKSQDLTLSWDTVGEQEKVYLSICADGVPCIVKELVDNGSVMVNKNEFTDFVVGKKVSIRLFRGIEQCLEQDGKTVCIDAIIHSRSLFLDILE